MLVWMHAVLATGFPFYRTSLRPRATLATVVGTRHMIALLTAPGELRCFWAGVGEYDGDDKRLVNSIGDSVPDCAGWTEALLPALTAKLEEEGNTVSPPQLLYWDQEAAAVRRRAWRISTNGEVGRCTEILGSHSDGPDMFSELLQALYETLEASTPQLLSSRIVNIGAAGEADPIRPLVLQHRNIFRGVYVDPGTSHVAQMREDLAGSGMHLHEGYATPETIEGILRDGGLLEIAPHWIDVLKVDIDTYDCDVANAILELVGGSLIVIMEVNPLPPPIMFARHFAKGVQESNEVPHPLHGCSLAYQVRLLERHGLVLWRYTGQDAVYLHREVLSALQTRPEGMDEMLCYQEATIMQHRDIPIRFSQEWFFQLTPAEALGAIHSNLSAILRRRGIDPWPLQYTLALPI